MLQSNLLSEGRSGSLELPAGVMLWSGQMPDPGSGYAEHLAAVRQRQQGRVSLCESETIIIWLGKVRTLRGVGLLTSGFLVLPLVKKTGELKFVSKRPHAAFHHSKESMSLGQVVVCKIDCFVCMNC